MTDTATAPAATQAPRIEIRNPANGKVIGSIPIHTADEVRAAVQRAREAQKDWGALTVKERCRRLLVFRDVVVDRAEEICKWISEENGKTIQEALFMELLLVADLATFFCKHGPKILAPRKLKLHLTPNRTSTLHYVPRGVLGIIAPWNFPFSIPMGETIMGLIAGNAIVLKPSEVTPLISLHAKEMFEQAGLPRELFQIVTGDGRTGAALIDAGVNQVIFTGSVATGRKVAAACGERLIPCTVELGGKSAAVVCADADLDRTAQALVWGAFANSGQVCVSVERVYAVDAIYDPLKERLVKLTQALRQGDPSKPDTDVGAMPFARQLETVRDQVDKARTAGAKILTGGSAPNLGGQFFSPTIVENPAPDQDVVRRESFGPVLPLMRVKDEQEAVARANDSHLGLMGYVFTKDVAKGRRLALSIQAGSTMVNDVLSTFGSVETPWGGVKESGIGRTHSEEGLRDLCELRHVNSNKRWLPSFSRELWWYPYSQKTYELGLKVVRTVYGRNSLLGRIARWFF